MPYGTIKIDTITFTDAGVDKSIAVSGLVQNPTFTGNVTVTGTVSGATVRATTVSGVTVSGTTANFASGVYTTQISGAIVKVPAGTAGAPTVQVGTGASIAPGLYSPNTDELGISTGGSFRLVVDSTGRVGIGTSAPGVKLEVFGASNANEIRSSDGTIISQWYQDTGGASIFGTVSNHPQVFRTNSAERMRIDSSGRVGIGTSSPSNTAGYSQQLELAGSIPCITLNQTNAGFTLRKYSVGVDTGGSLGIWDNNVSAYRFYIDSSGNVGIGTSSPSTYVQNNGLVVYRNANNSQPNFSVVNASALSSAASVLQVLGNGGSCLISATSSGWGDYGIFKTASTILESQNNFLAFAAPSGLLFGGSTSPYSEFMRITNAGFVGIGTSAPSSYEHGGTNNVIEIKNSNNSVNAQSHFLCSTGYTGNGITSIGGVSGILPDISATVKLGAYIVFATDTTHTAASPQTVLVFATRSGTGSPSEAFRFTNDKYGRFGSATGGLQFNGDTAAANALDDYEEGTWTPIDGSGAGLSFNVAAASYTKIGRYVICQFALDYPATSNANAANIGGLPFVNSNTGGGFSMYTTSTAGSLALRNNTNTTNMLLTSGVDQDAPVTNVTLSTAAIQCTFMYQVGI